ncbi:MAG: SCO1664 family protein [Actinomycetes bacterium]
MSALELSDDQIAEVLRRGRLEVVGRMRYSSNGAFFVNASAEGAVVPAVYKPRRGERPLWDFPDGTLCQREVAACVLSDALGWGLVPVTVMRDDGPLGAGAIQRFVEHDPEEHYFTLLDGNEDRFRRFAVFDILANNTDRKGGHCLHDLASDEIVGIDHGLTFHPQWKLRTVIWDFADEAVPAELLDDVTRFLADLEAGPAGGELADLLAPYELAALGVRAADLLLDGHFPPLDPGYHSYPWPLV